MSGLSKEKGIKIKNGLYSFREILFKQIKKAKG
jgi:hypothetical protein